MLLSDMGAEVLRIDRPDAAATSPSDITSRGRSSLVLDLKSKAAIVQCLDLSESADVLIEGFRPGVMERLGLGPQQVLERNPRLIYARMTGWGQEGPLAQAAGHEINYIAITGALAALGPSDRPPPPPLNLIGDFGGGSLYLVMGVLAALLERAKSGQGQVVDAAIVDGTLSLMSMAFSFRHQGWGERGHCVLDGSAHFYRCYECADGRHLAVGALEPRFYRQLLQRIGATSEAIAAQSASHWATAGEHLAQLFKTRTRDEWMVLLEGTDACVAPVLSLEEAASHPHIIARSALIEHDAVTQPAPAPRFSRTPAAIQSGPPRIGEGGAQMAQRWASTRNTESVP